MRNLILAISAAALSVPAMPTGAFAYAPQETRSWRGADGRLHCKRANGTTGFVVGGAAGVLGGRAIDRRGDRATGTILGGALGALVGRQVQRNMLSRCR